MKLTESINWTHRTRGRTLLVMILLVSLCLLAGAITTLAGMGGGLILLLGLSMVMDPLTALVITGPALLVGNAHRAVLYRRHIRRPLAWRFVLGAGPGAVLGGLVAVAVPETLLRVALVGLAVAAAAKVIGGWSFTPPPGALVPGGAAAGFVTATSGGGGLIAGPLWLASGLTGRAYAGTGAVGGVVVHLCRMGGYGAGGVLEGDALLMGLVGAACIAGGNLIGERARRRLKKRLLSHLEVGVVMTCLLLALLGLG